jgi:hypothetical protein
MSVLHALKIKTFILLLPVSVGRRNVKVKKDFKIKININIGLLLIPF